MKHLNMTLYLYLYNDVNKKQGKLTCHLVMSMVGGGGGGKVVRCVWKEPYLPLKFTI